MANRFSKKPSVNPARASKLSAAGGGMVDMPGLSGPKTKKFKVGKASNKANSFMKAYGR